MSLCSVSRPRPAPPRLYGLVAHDGCGHFSVDLSAGQPHCGHLLCKDQALNDTHGFRLQLEKTEKGVKLFDSHDRANGAQWRNLNKKFMEGLGVEDQTVRPCIVFFRVHAENIENVSIYRRAA